MDGAFLYFARKTSICSSGKFMAQISPIGPSSDPISNLTPGQIKNGPASSPQRSVQSDEAQTSTPLQAQLTRLSSVLNGLQSNAALSRAQYVQAYNKVKSGSYNVDALEVSRSIVEDMLTKQ
jgi:anti-sigma28 factor (negative regulator of flagellin synthesis)